MPQPPGIWRRRPFRSRSEAGLFQRLSADFCPLFLKRVAVCFPALSSRPRARQYLLALEQFVVMGIHFGSPGADFLPVFHRPLVIRDRPLESLALERPAFKLRHGALKVRIR